tara:strand:- start:7633 stop:8349 length:717 start_codon:yes stop_codon:yes gene_type:complete
MHNDFNWGEMIDWSKELTQEMQTERVYHAHREIQLGDVVLDIGANVGAFAEATMAGLSKPLANPSYNTTKIYCIEPYAPHFKCLTENMAKWGDRVQCSKIALAETREVTVDTCTNPKTDSTRVLDFQSNAGITFQQYVETMNIDKINFMKMDVEGYEYQIITPDNYKYVYSKVDHIAAEYHTFTKQQKADFARFREGVLKHTPNFQIIAVNGVDITWDLYNQHFLDFYNQFYIYINNS